MPRAIVVENIFLQKAESETGDLWEIGPTKSARERLRRAYDARDEDFPVSVFAYYANGKLTLSEGYAPGSREAKIEAEFFQLTATCAEHKIARRQKA